jgi:outer membrane protein TolC
MAASAVRWRSALCALAFAVLSLGTARAADEVARLGPEDVLAAVDATHPLVAAARARVRGAEGERVASEGALDPTLKAKVQAKPGAWDSQSVTLGAPLRVWGGDVSAGWSRGVGDFEPWQGDLGTAAAGEAVVGWTLPLLRDSWTDRRRTTRDRAGRELDVAAAEVRARTLEVRRAALHRYWDWVAAGARVRVAQGLLDLANVRDTAFAAQVELGDAAAIVREDSRRLVLERTDRLVQARRALEQARIELSMHLRDADGRRVLAQDSVLPVALVAPVDATRPVAIEAALALARERRPELARLDALRAQVDLDARLQANQVLPSLDVIGEGTVPLDGEKRAWKLGAQTDWTIGARPARGRLEAARAGLARLDEERTFARDRVDADVLDAASALDAARARLGVVSTLTGVAARVAEAERARFAIGDSNLIFVNQREIAVAEAELLVIDATLAACRGWVDWLAAQGVLGE